MFNIILLPASFKNHFTNFKHIHNYYTRSLETHFYHLVLTKKVIKKLLAYQGSKLWAELPLC